MIVNVEGSDEVMEVFGEEVCESLGAIGNEVPDDCPSLYSFEYAYACTRSKGHSGLHIAMGGPSLIIAVWLDTQPS